MSGPPYVLIFCQRLVLPVPSSGPWPGSPEGRLPGSAATKPGLCDRPAIHQIEVGRVAVAALGLLPATGDRVSVLTDSGDETLIEWRALPPELPLAIVDGHLIHPTHAALVGVELEVGPIGGIATHHGQAVGRLGDLDGRSLRQMCSGRVPCEGGASAARPGLSAR